MLPLDSPLQRRRLRAGFTLVEVLVAMTVLILIVTLIVQLMNNATAVTTISNKHLAADDAARTVFNTMENDFAGMATRPDLDYFFYKNTQAGTTNPGNDSMYCWSNAPGYTGGGATGASGAKISASDESPMSLVGYRIPSQNNRPDSQGTVDNLHPNFVLERVGRPFQWAGGYAMMFLSAPPPPNPGASPTPYPKTTITRFSGANTTLGPAPYTDGDYRASVSPAYIVSPECFRMEFCYLLKSGTYFLPSAPPATTYGTDMRRISTDVAAVVVGFAFLDTDSRKTIPATLLPTVMAKAAAALPDLVPADLTTNPPNLMEQKWNAVINAGSPTWASVSGLPKTVAGQVRIYQRTFRIPSK